MRKREIDYIKDDIAELSAEIRNLRYRKDALRGRIDDLCDEVAILKTYAINQEILNDEIRTEIEFLKFKIRDKAVEYEK